MSVQAPSDAAKDRITSVQLGTVQETLLTPLCARADQLHRDDCILRDPTAFRMVEQIDYDFDSIRRYRDTLVGCAIRAAVFDRWIQEFLDLHEEASVVLIGIGLDTCFERNDNGKATWFEIDFPDVIELRKQLLEPSDRRETIAGSVFDTKWIDIVRNRGASSFLFQIAGVTMYLPPAQVQELFTLLADHFPGSTVLFDCCSTMAKRNSARWEATVRTTGAKYQWGIDDPRDIAAWDPRFEVTDVKWMMDHHRHQWSWKTRFFSRVYPPLRRAYQLNRAIMLAGSNDSHSGDS